jgi:hypothetical protein
MREREEIAVEAIKRHGQPTLSGADVIRVGLILNEIQDQTFNLGVRYGMDLLFKALRQSTETQ